MAANIDDQPSIISETWPKEDIAQEQEGSGILPHTSDWHWGFYFLQKNSVTNFDPTKESMNPGPQAQPSLYIATHCTALPGQSRNSFGPVYVLCYFIESNCIFLRLREI